MIASQSLVMNVTLMRQYLFVSRLLVDDNDENENNCSIIDVMKTSSEFFFSIAYMSHIH